MANSTVDGSEIVFDDNCCVICNNGFVVGAPPTTVTRGLPTLIRFSEKRNRAQLSAYLQARSEMEPVGKVLVHSKCRRLFIDKKRVVQSDATDIGEPAPKILRSSISPFNFKGHCFICGMSAVVDIHHRTTKIHRVELLHMRQMLLEHCDVRSDAIASVVRIRLQSCIDLVAAEAVYHHECLMRFKLNKDLMPQNATSDTTGQATTGVGRKVDKESEYWFHMTCDWLETEAGADLYTLFETEAGADLYTLFEIHNKMQELAGSYKIYSMKWLKEMLKQHYGDFLFFAEVDGRSNVICFRNMARYLVNEKWHADRRDNFNDEAERIVLTAAKLIRSQIKEQDYDIKQYPGSEDISNIVQGQKWIPHYLKVLLGVLVPSELKQNSIGHSIVQSSRPRSVITPTLFGLGVELDHVFGSKWLVNELYRLGFSISYDEVTRYKSSVIQTESSEGLISDYFPGTFTQWVADNVDHNVATLDGKGTFHGMGIIAVSTPPDGTSLCNSSRTVYRQKRTNVDSVVQGKGVPISHYLEPPKKGLSTIKYKPFSEMRTPYTLPPALNSDLLWHAGWHFCKTTSPRPNWSGFMQHVFSEGDCNAKSEVIFLPIIDLNPSDESCIYSTLLFIEKQAAGLNVQTPCVTFDQPLWLKSVDIITAMSMNIVCRLGGFHTMMSFMGSIGSMMNGSGLEEALEVVYGPNAVGHMMSGKAVSRALRGHFLVQSALVNKLIDVVMPTTDGLTCSDELHISRLDNDDVEALECLVNDINSKDVPTLDISKSHALVKLNKDLSDYELDLSGQSRTAKLWIHYIEYVDVLKMFIRGERTGDWHLHLVAVEKMLNLFAATGHINYAKSCRLYLQMMLELPTDHPWLYSCFMEHGFHSVRRSDRYWAGLSTDLVIEQALMRSLKSRGGLTRGRGFTDSVVLQWVHSMHRCAETHEAMTTLTRNRLRSSEQHVEMDVSRCKRDNTDLVKVQTWFDEHEPFDINEPRLRSLSSGLTSRDGDGVNCDETELHGSKIQTDLDGKDVSVATIKRSAHVKSLDSLCPAVMIDNKKVNIDPTIVFCRLIAIAQRESDMVTYFQYELTPVPTSLFKDNFLRKPAKTVLAQSLTESIENSKPPQSSSVVLDGGALLHRVKWAKKSTYMDIAEQYVSYIHTKYDTACVVFDGYTSGPSTKDHEHMRRIGKTCADVKIKENTQAHPNQHIFLSNTNNKVQFIDLLSRVFETHGLSVCRSTGDADILVVRTAIEIAASGRVVRVIADDTDIVVLLLHHWRDDMADVYLQSDARRSSWSIKELVGKCGKITQEHILFIHAWSGCDTTSSTFGHGKSTLLNRIQSSNIIQNLGSTIEKVVATVDQVSHAGVELFKILCGGKTSDTLTTLRHTKFMNMASSRTSIEPQKLPPTERAAHFHSLRVHLQVAIWSMFQLDVLDPKEWGWKLDGTQLVPITTDLEPAPNSILKFVRCQCKLKSRSPCSTNICSCRKHGLMCVASCGDCRGEGCNNCDGAVVNDSDSSDEE